MALEALYTDLEINMCIDLDLIWSYMYIVYCELQYQTLQAILYQFARKPIINK